MTNILILSVGTRNKIIKYFKDNLKSHGNVIATDLSYFAPALYEADKFYITPKITDKNYINSVLDICVQEKITGILSLIDPELEILGDNIEIFSKNNIKLLQSPSHIIKKSFNKYDFFKQLKSLNIPTQLSYIMMNDIKKALADKDIHFPLFVKPNKGSASININKVNDIDTLETLMKNHDDLIIQEFIEGKEYGVDVYVDFISQKVISVFIKEKIKMRAGETDKSIAVHNMELIDLVTKFVVKMGYLGQIDIDIFEKDNQYYISEVNPRFGGGYPHAYEAGCNFPKYIINNLKGIENTPQIGRYKPGSVMMKYNEIKFIE